MNPHLGLTMLPGMPKMIMGRHWGPAFIFTEFKQKTLQNHTA